MPVVRSYGQQQIEQRPIAGVKNTLQPESAFTPVAAAGLRLVDGIMQRRADQIDQTAALEAHNQLSTWRQNKLQEALQTTGKDAFDLPDTIGKQFDDYAGTVEHGLTNQRQRLAFERVKAEQRESLKSTLFAHAGRERDHYFTEQADSAVKLAISDAVANSDNPSRIADELGRGEGVIRARLQGQAPETVQHAVLGFQTQVHLGVIGRLLDGDKDQMAQAYYDAAKDQIAGDQRAKVEAAIETGTLRGNAQKQSDAIMAASTSMSEALDQTRAIEDPKLRDEVQQRVEHEWNIRKQAEREGAENLMVTAANQIDKGGIRAVPSTLWSQLEPGQRESLERYAKRNVKGEAGDGTDAGLVRFYRLREMAVSDPEKFKQLNLLNEIGTLGKTEFKSITDMQMDMRQGKATKVAELHAGIRTETQVVNDTLASNGIPTSGTHAKPAAEARFRRAVSERTAALEQSTGKKATEEDVQSIADDVIAKSVDIPGMFWGHTTKKAIDVEIGDIPAATQRQIKAALQKYGVQPTDANVVQTYIDQQLRGAK